MLTIRSTVLPFGSLFFGGLFAGFLLTVLVLETTLRGFDAAVYTQVRQVELIRLDDLATATLLPALIATAALVALGARTWPTIAALVLLASVLVLTLTVNLPINTEQLDWTVPAPPADWAAVRDRWQIAHAIRTGAALLAFGLLCAGPAQQPR